MFKLREYQQRCVDDTLSYLSNKSPAPGIIVQPTAAGKSLIISKIAEEFDGNVLVLCHSEEILRQNYNKYTKYGNEACIYSAAFKRKEICGVTFATLASIKNKGDEFKKSGVSLVCWDEAHLNSSASGGMATTFLNKLKPKYLLGLTATPFRLKNYSDPSGYSYSQLAMMNRMRPKLFKEIVHITQISELVSNGYWAHVNVHDEQIDPLGLVYNSTGSDFTESSVKEVNKKNNVNNRIFKQIKELLANGVKSILVFMDTVENCYIMQKALGDISQVIEAKTNKKLRPEIISDFEGGRINVLINNSTLTTGFDFPALECVIMGRPTGSLSVFYQIFGRLVRPFEDKIGNFYDYGNNIQRFGDPRDLSIENFEGYGWGVFSGDKLLTGKPIDGPDVTKEDLLKLKEQKFKPGTKRMFEFGAHSGKFASEVPVSYLRWAVMNAKGNMTENLFNECQKIIATQI